MPTGSSPIEAARRVSSMNARHEAVGNPPWRSSRRLRFRRAARLDLRRVRRSSPARREDLSSGGGRSDPLFGAEVIEAAGERDSAGQHRVDDPKHRVD